jgi:GNAT superfamily N-acetyltransferase
MEIRIATGADADAIEAVRVRGWQTAYRHVFPPAELDAMPVDGARLRPRLEKPPPGWATLVAQDDGVIGFATIGPSRDETGLGELYAIYVDPSAWSTGTGRELLLRAEAELRRYYAVATLWVLEDNPRARRFYELGGWVPDGTRKAEDFLGVRVAEVRYRKELR